MLTTPSYLTVRTMERSAERDVPRVVAKERARTPAREGHSRAEIAALLGTMFLLLPFGLLLMLGL